MQFVSVAREPGFNEAWTITAAVLRRLEAVQNLPEGARRAQHAPLRKKLKKLPGAAHFTRTEILALFALLFATLNRF